MTSQPNSHGPRTPRFDSLQQEAYLRVWRLYDRLKLLERRCEAVEIEHVRGDCGIRVRRRFEVDRADARAARLDRRDARGADAGCAAGDDRRAHQ
mgnify:CR=1 FL=1